MPIVAVRPAWISAITMQTIPAAITEMLSAFWQCSNESSPFPYPILAAVVNFSDHMDGEVCRFLKLS